MEARKRLLSKIRKKSESGKQPPALTQLGYDTPSTPSKRLSNVPFRRDGDFVDRGNLMEDVKAKLSPPAGRAALVGLGGAG